MRNPRELSAADIADDLVKMHNLPTSDKATHDALLQEVNGYFQYNINKLKQEAQTPHSDGRPHDLRGDIIALFKNVENMTVFGKSPDEQSPFNVAYLDQYNYGGKNVFALNESPANRNLIPTCFQFTDAGPFPDNRPRLRFTIRTDGVSNPDFLYQEFSQQNQPYKTWSQYWGGGTTSGTPSYQQGREGKGKYNF